MRGEASALASQRRLIDSTTLVGICAGAGSRFFAAAVPLPRPAADREMGSPPCPSAAMAREQPMGVDVKAQPAPAWQSCLAQPHVMCSGAQGSSALMSVNPPSGLCSGRMRRTPRSSSHCLVFLGRQQSSYSPIIALRYLMPSLEKDRQNSSVPRGSPGQVPTSPSEA